METKKYGFKPSLIVPDVHWYLGDGSMNPPILQLDGDWTPFIPVDDLQNKNGLETENCTSYGTLHAIGTLGNREFNTPTSKPFQALFSERYTGVMTNTTPSGNDPQKVSELIRTTCGLVPQVFLPFDSTITSWRQYYSPNPMSYALYAAGAHWLKKYRFQHQWITLPGDSQQVVRNKMKTALQYSPLGASVFAWSQHADGYYYSDQPYFNHWIEIIKLNPDGSTRIFDSYDKTIKTLEPNFVFGQIKGYGLDFNTGGQNLGDAPEQVVIPYIGYLAGNYIKSIFK